MFFSKKKVTFGYFLFKKGENNKKLGATSVARGGSVQYFDKEKYAALAKARAGKSPIAKNFTAAFLVGGGLCLLGQLLLRLYTMLGASEKTGYLLVTVSLIFLSALLTVLGVFDRIARFAGAGTLLPVTGFANAVVSPAMDNKSEGFVMGVGAKMFLVAGPVLVFGIAAGAVLGLLTLLVGLFA